MTNALDGVDVTEAPGLSPDGKSLTVTYEIENAAGPVTFAADAEGGATVTSNATILRQLGLDHERLTFKFQGLDQKLTVTTPATVVTDQMAPLMLDRLDW